MPTDITMPKLSDTMTEGRLVSWKKSVGDRVERGEIIAEVETDKATMELEAFASGTLAEQRAKPGELVAVGTVIGVIGEAGEAAPAPPEESKPPVEDEQEPPPETTPAATAGDVPEKVMELPEEQASAPSAPEAERGEGERAAPMVRRMARERGIDLGLVTGSGPEGRILQEDLERYLAERPESETPAVAAGEESAGESLSRMRRAIVRVTTQSWQTIPHFYETIEIAMKESGEIIRELKGSGSEVTYNDLVVKASAMALLKYPKLNASFVNDRLVTHGDVNIGIAVAVDNGLLVPVVKGCQGLALKEIAMETVRLGDRARSGKISQDEIAGGTFSISNLGMFGIDEFVAVIFPPQAAILAVGAVADRPVVKDGRVVAAKTMRVTLSCDHRIVDGAYAAQFLGELRRVLENPVLMLV
ncbi:dihydrolipoamide acetyltransferase family protein [Geobacter benzoatilyticus]|uniref:Dihydrolipoamide acetyltransferase component of pyruvate dehydrogenase complex n=1 Tax=Geobacter benzoatilyticus TaxID=2815309 RepID=A0ABX7Q0H6_9BACT|nr:dihydrolipoamide acetyltransferase family protein [Geobacter benzoatilyticus]QSV44446.1 2-oxo acid dehydrogenase subunit E2 [Geobacter benzoatilyticus]